MTAHTRIGGSWKNVDEIHAKVAGSWKQVGEGYVKIDGSWDRFYKSFNGVDESALGTPFLTAQQGDSLDALGGYPGPAFFAIDVQPFYSETRGNIWGQGGGFSGAAMYLVPGGTLRAVAYNGSAWKNSGQSWVEADVSAYYNEAGTFYFYATSGDGIKVWWVGESSGINLLGTGDPQTGNIWGSFDGKVGLVSGPPDMGVSSQQNYSGTIDELRWWQSGPPTSLQ